jgi:iron complex outermembrane receptor protein
LLGPAAYAQQDRGTGADADASEPASAGANQPNEPPAGVEEIVIQGAAAAPLPDIRTESVVLFDAEEIAALGIADVTDLADFSPNLEIISPGETTATFFIRGVGLQDFSASAPSAVAIYQDDVPMNAPPLQVPQIFDIENVAVLRGPQGTKVGRNASAGAIKINSRKPNLDSPEANLRISNGSLVSDVTPGAFVYDYEGGLGVPIVPEVVAGRIAFRASHTDPFWRNGCGGAPPIGQRPTGPGGSRIPICGEGSAVQAPPIPAGLDKIVGDRNVWAARGQLRFQPPGTDMDWIVNGHGSRRDQDGTFGQAIGTGPRGENFGSSTRLGYTDSDQVEELRDLRNQLRAEGLGLGQATRLAQAELSKLLAEKRPLDRDPYRGDFRRNGRNVLDTYGTYLRGQMNLGETEFSTTTGWDGFHRFTDNDTDLNPNIDFEISQTVDAWQLTQDFQLGRQVLDSVRLDAGAYYLMERLESNPLILFRGDSQQDVLRFYEQDIYSVGSYLNFTWDISDVFQVEGGVRYNFEDKSFDLTQVSSFRNPAFAQTVNFRDTVTWHAPTGGLSFTWFVTPEISSYWKYSHGWKSGVYNSNSPPGADNASDPLARPELIDAFEWGLKASFLESRVRTSASLFYYAYQDYQVFLFEDVPNAVPFLKVINANDAEVLGAEADAEIRPIQDLVPSAIEELVLEIRGGWLKSQFLDFQNIIYRDNVPKLEDYTGNTLPNSPRFQFSGGARWTFDLGRYGSITPRYDFSWQDDTFFDVTEGRGSTDRFGSVASKPEFTTGQRAYILHNVRLTWSASEGAVQLSGWCRNVTDQRYKTYAFDATTFAGLVVNFVSDPRSCGGEIAFTW